VFYFNRLELDFLFADRDFMLRYVARNSRLFSSLPNRCRRLHATWMQHGARFFTLGNGAELQRISGHAKSGASDSSDIG
jgi:hypothetical protein